MFPLMEKAGHDGALKLVALTKLHFSCLGYWPTRTMRWSGSWEKVRAHITTCITMAAGVITEDAGTVPRKSGANGQMTELCTGAMYP